jgi:hypothetical protein
MVLLCESLEPPTSLEGHDRSFGDVGSMSGLRESGHGGDESGQSGGFKKPVIVTRHRVVRPV